MVLNIDRPPSSQGFSCTGWDTDAISGSYIGAAPLRWFWVSPLMLGWELQFGPPSLLSPFLLAVPQFTQWSHHPFTPHLSQAWSQAERHKPLQGSRLSGKWAGGPGQGWGGQAQLQGWLCWERGLLIQPSPIEHKAAWAKGDLIKKTRGSYLPVGTCSLCRQLSLNTDPQTWLWTWGRSCAAGISVLTCQGNPSPAPAKAVCAGAKVWRNGEGWRGARGRARDAGPWKDNWETERGRVMAETRAEMGRGSERAGVRGQDGTSSLQRLICILLKGRCFPFNVKTSE